jgi:hypothetical protein
MKLHKDKDEIDAEMSDASNIPINFSDELTTD